MFRSSNPALNQKMFNQARSYGVGEAMTVQGMVNKSFVLLALLVVTASWVWSKIVQPTPIFGAEEAAAQTTSAVGPWLMVGLIGGLIAAIVTIFNPKISPITAPIYALFEGLLIGGISAVFEMAYPGIVLQATALTFGVLFSMLAAYKSGLIKVTDRFRLGIVSAVGAIFLIYMVNFIMGFFGSGMSFMHSSSVMGIGFSVVVVGIAALSLALDFDLVDRLAAQGSPRYMEWYGAFSLMVTLIWLYLEILRLLAKLNNRR